MGTPAKKARRQEQRKPRSAPGIGISLGEAKKLLSAPQQRSARLIDNVLREAGSADGPADLSSNLRRYLSEQ
jgi:hypothetical protein